MSFCVLIFDNFSWLFCQFLIKFCQFWYIFDICVLIFLKFAATITFQKHQENVTFSKQMWMSIYKQNEIFFYSFHNFVSFWSNFFYLFVFNLTDPYDWQEKYDCTAGSGQEQEGHGRTRLSTFHSCRNKFRTLVVGQ